MLVNTSSGRKRMDEQKRTKILAGILVAVLCFMAIRPDKALVEPVRDAEQNRDNAQSEFDREEIKHMQLLVARENISRGRATSLPYSISDAQRLYQSWITNLAEQCRFAQLQVSPGRTEYRRNQYLTVNVDIEAETDLDGLCRFLYLVDQADLMHRISSLDINSTGSQSNPRMEITLSAQGMSVAGSPNRSEIFPRTHTSSAVDQDSTELTVNDLDGFPKKTPFLAQIGREMVNVTGINGSTWTVERGQQGTDALQHAADENVQLFPVPVVRQSSDYEDYKELIAASPFTKPKPPREYRPRIASIMDRTIEPGETVTMTARAEDINRDIGAPEFALEDAAEGMAIDAESGELTWAPAEDLKPDTYTGTVVLTQKNNADLRVEKKFSISIKVPNDAPGLTVRDSAIVILGQEFKMEASAEDDGPPEQLKFSFEGDVPEGLAIDEASGLMTWSPPKTFTPGEHTVTVKVTDSGSPAKSATSEVKLKVEDDHAILTRFTGSVALDGVPSAYFRNLGTNDRPVLKIGDRVVVSEIDAKVTEISSRHVLLADARGIWKLNLGANLRERELVEPAEEPETEKPEAEQESKAEAYDKDPAPLPAELPDEEDGTQPAEKPEKEPKDSGDAEPDSEQKTD